MIEDRSGGYPRHPRLDQDFITTAEFRTLAASYLGYRWVAYSIIGLLGAGAAVVHLWWLPSHGINGWTGEPREKYLELVGGRRR